MEKESKKLNIEKRFKFYGKFLKQGYFCRYYENLKTIEVETYYLDYKQQGINKWYYFHGDIEEISTRKLNETSGIRIEFNK